MRRPFRAVTGVDRQPRRWSIRTLLVVLAIVPSLALVGLWGFTTTQVWSETNEFKDQNSIASRAGTPAYTVMLQFQEERRLSAAWLAAPNDAVKAALQASRARTDVALADFTKLLEGLTDTRDDVLDKARRIEADRDLLPVTRERIDRREGQHESLLKPYTDGVATQMETFATLSHFDADGHLTARAEIVIAMFRVGELLAREDMLVTYAEASRKLGTDAYLQFTQTVGARRTLVDEEILPYLEDEFLRGYQAMAATPPWRTMSAIEDAVLATAARAPVSSTGFTLPTEAAGWRAALDQTTLQWVQFNTQRAGSLVEESQRREDDLETTLWLITGSGLAVVVVVTVLCWGITRSLRRRLLGLQRATSELAEERLPAVIDRLSRGEDVDTAAELPELPRGKDEIGQVAQAFNAAQRTALDGAVRLAREREGHAKVFHNVALRTQSLVGRQLRALDAMENRHQDPEVLDDLFVLDHLATRLRRYEENLVILSGHQPGRRWSRPVRVIDVVRSAVGEVEDYSRIDVHVAADLALAGGAVGPVIHLLAELLENATTFSPPDTPVEVRGMTVAKGLVVEIEDRGLGMGEAEYAGLNAELENPKAFDMVALADDVRLGLFVVAQLAQRYGITVTLRPSPYGGTLAIVFLPKELIVGQGGQEDPEIPDDAQEPQADAEPAPLAAATPLPLPAVLPGPVPVAAVRGADGGDADRAGDPGDAGANGAGRTENAESTDAADSSSGARDAVAPVVSTSAAPNSAASNASASNSSRGNPAGTSSAAATGSAAKTPASGSGSRPKPLPRRVRQASLAAPLRDVHPVPPSDDALSDGDGASNRPSPRQAAATISAFQRASERARAAELTTEPPTRDRP